ncbi:MAG: histidine phosphatase family protein, partial [Dialister sp.]|nr:histidine phosphatase family protein [Dialister sp.]
VRTMTFMKELLSRGDHKSYAIVSHGAALRTIICAMIDIPLSRSWNMGLSNASITEIRHFVGENNMNDMNMLFSLNQIAHLADTATSHLPR